MQGRIHKLKETVRIWKDVPRYKSLIPLICAEYELLTVGVVQPRACNFGLVLGQRELGFEG